MVGIAQAVTSACAFWTAASQRAQSPVDRWWAGMAVGADGDTRRMASIDFVDIGVPMGSDQTKALMSREVQVLNQPVLSASNLEENYQIIVQAGEAWRAQHPYEGDTFGVIMTAGTSPQPVNGYDSATGVSTSEVFVSDDPDFASLIHKDGQTYMIVHLENRPGATYFLELAQDTSTGRLSLIRSTHMDWSTDGGMWVPCAGTLSPWNTHLGAEEYEPDAKAWAQITEFQYGSRRRTTTARGAMDWMRYHNVYPEGDFSTWKTSFDANFHPYQLGYSFEAGPDAGSYFATKRMAMGRRSGELPFVMPDRRTVYLTDDGSNVFLSIFYADAADDLSAGELFCARMTQTSATNGGAFSIEWISMGNAQESSLRSASTTTTFADLFDEADPISSGFPAVCPDTFTAVHGSAGLECLKVKAGQETLASRFESRRYAGLLGCTTEWNKMEGFTYSVDSGKGYIAMSTIARGMEDLASSGTSSTDYDAGTGNMVRLPYNRCGCIYEMTMDSQHRATNMNGVLCGREGNGSDSDNRCSTAGISNPDNVAAIQGHAALLIGEDTGNHLNNIMWKYDLDSGTLQERIAAVPMGAEVCSPYYYPDVGGFSYLTMVVQHPGSDYSGAAGIGYAVWERQCGATYPGWAMPGDGSADRCQVETSVAAWRPCFAALLVLMVLCLLRPQP
mmetsp:Transcript_107098/g.313199  ORF Transcript_107098/g.313199 Transcript_107098/m.313199 type:complete len:675 (+) Transcript_107098:128-2152(+)